MAADGVKKVVYEERPWGSWSMWHQEDGFKVKQLRVNEGGRLSYQFHNHRSEHWFVAKGTATLTIEGEIYTVPKGGHFDVPVHTKHRIANFGTDELVIVEVQTGDYLEEDDIVRVEDDYNRVDSSGSVTVDVIQVNVE